MVGRHYRLNGHEFEQTLLDSEGQGSLLCCIPWSHKESDMTEPLINNSHVSQFLKIKIFLIYLYTYILIYIYVCVCSLSLCIYTSFLQCNRINRMYVCVYIWDFPGSSSGKELTCQCRRCGFDSWVRKVPWRRK